MEEIRYDVPGVSCSHCEQAIAAEVGTVAGVESVDVDLNAKTVVVRGHGLDEASVRAAIAEVGYQAR
jgi:copper chaperone CopZ